MSNDLDIASNLLAKLEDNVLLVPPDPRWTLTLALRHVVAHLRSQNVTPAPPPSPSEATAGETSDVAPKSLDICTVHQLVAYQGSCFHCGGDRNLRRYDLATGASSDAATVAALRRVADAALQWRDSDEDEGCKMLDDALDDLLSGGLTTSELGGGK